MEHINRDMRRAVCAALMRAARQAKPVSEGRARLTAMAALVRRMRRAFP